MTLAAQDRFETFFRDPLYLLYKNHLYNFLVRRFVVRRLLRGRIFRQVLEVGCGISPMLEAERGAIRTDLSWRALAILGPAARSGPATRAVSCSATELPFRTNSLDGVVCSEVLEHVREDGKAMEEIQRVLAPGGELFLTCPIQEKYFGFDDEFVGHFRRYEVAELVKTLQEKGFKEIEIRPILGTLEKQIMTSATRFFSRLRSAEGEVRRPLGLPAKLAAWMFFPLYLIGNYFVASLVYLQARFQPLERIVTVAIRCRKSI